MKSLSLRRNDRPASPAGLLWTGCLVAAALLSAPPVRSADFGERTPSVSELISALNRTPAGSEEAGAVVVGDLPEGVRTRGLKIVGGNSASAAAENAASGNRANVEVAGGSGARVHGAAYAPGSGRVSMSIQFDLNSDRIHRASADSLANLAAALTSTTLRDRRFEVVGHTDVTGSPAYNLKLSERRARSVAEFLSMVGVDLQRARASGRGPAELLADVAPDSALQRRVEIRIVND